MRALKCIGQIICHYGPEKENVITKIYELPLNAFKYFSVCKGEPTPSERETAMQPRLPKILPHRVEHVELD
jgi:hypothetical protein